MIYQMEIQLIAFIFRNYFYLIIQLLFYFNILSLKPDDTFLNANIINSYKILILTKKSIIVSANFEQETLFTHKLYI